MIPTTRLGCKKLLGNNVWIFDTGTSRHMIANLNFLKVTNIEVGLMELLDGVFRVGKVQGNMDLDPNIKLSNVLHILNFNVIWSQLPH